MYHMSQGDSAGVLFMTLCLSRIALILFPHASKREWIHIQNSPEEITAKVMGSLPATYFIIRGQRTGSALQGGGAVALAQA